MIKECLTRDDISLFPRGRKRRGQPQFGAHPDPEVESCHGVPWELDGPEQEVVAQLQRWEIGARVGGGRVGSGWTSEM